MTNLQKSPKEFGMLIDALLTEPEKVNFEKRQLLSGIESEEVVSEYSENEFNVALQLRDSVVKASEEKVSSR